ncbi:MAG: methyl-accepting chemotaxis protein, partial [Gammaproteobacteria bacterium]
VNQAIPGLLAASDELANLLVRDQADPAQVYVAGRQLMITQRIANNLNLMLAGGDTASAATAGLAGDVELFERVLQGLLSGSSSPKIERIDDADARTKLGEVGKTFETISAAAAPILEAAPRLAEIGLAAGDVQSQSTGLIVNAAALEASLGELGETKNPLTYVGYLLGFLSLLVMLLLAYKFVQDARRQLEITTNQNRRNQRAILRLLDEMTNLAEGDLTMRATVTEDITGAIADSVNYAIDALRGLVTTINHTSVQVASSAEKTQSTTQRLADASNYQAREIASASAAITEMADSIEQVSKNALTSAEVAQRSVEIAHKGAQTVSRTIDGMDTIREQIQETSKRIKRLGESSQEIGDIVSLINEIADQTNILALNAAIQASTAGEAGRGFAVVADEVQRLAERAGNATKQIEALVKTIQADTNEAVISMEQSTTNVVGGAKLAEDAGEALAEIESVSGQLAQLIQSISQSARQQASAAANITNTMNVIQEITMQTSEGTSEAANSVGNLTTLANELRRSVAGFKLPDADETDTVIIDPDDHPLQQSVQSVR